MENGIGRFNPTILGEFGDARIGPAQTGVIGSLRPLVTIVLAVWLLNKPFTLYPLGGFALVMAGVGLYVIPNSVRDLQRFSRFFGKASE